MPTYEYKCDACGHAFEKFQSMSSKPIRKCPVCGKSKVRRLIGTGAALIFKGSGFYITDYRSEAYKDSAKSDVPAAASSGEGAGSGSEGKPTTEVKNAGEAKATSEAKPSGEKKGAENKPSAPSKAAPEAKPAVASKSAAKASSASSNSSGSKRGRK